MPGGTVRTDCYILELPFRSLPITSGAFKSRHKITSNLLALREYKNIQSKVNNIEKARWDELEMNGILIGDIEVALIWASVIIFVLYAVFFFNKYRTTDVESQSWFYFGLALFCICFAMARVWFLFSDFMTTGVWSVSQLGPITIDADFYWRLAAIFGIGSVVFVLFVIERYMVKTHYIISLGTSIGLVIALIFPVTPIGRTATYIFTPIGVLGIVGLYGYLIKNSSGRIRTKTIFALLGIFMIFLGFVIDTDFGQDLLPFAPEIIGITASIVMTVGGLVFISGYRMDV